MNVSERRAELVHNIRYAIQQKHIRDTGMDIECWITEDASAVHGQIRSPDGVLKFTIPVVVQFEYVPNDNAMAYPRGPMSPSAGAEDERIRRLG